MARQRSSPRTEQTEPQTESQTTTKESKMALSDQEINDLLAGSRNKGGGVEAMKAFIESGEAGQEVDLTSGPFAGKQAGQAYIALNNAKKRTRTDESGATVLAMPEAKTVRVVKRNHGSKENPDWHVYLIDTSKVGVEA